MFDQDYHRAFTILIPVIILLSGCELQKAENEQEKSKIQAEVALKFMNDYIHSVHNESPLSPIDWLEKREDISDEYLELISNIITAGYEEDPELGLNYDPILCAQDFPSEGFVLDESQPTTDQIILRGKKWSDFKLTFKLIKQDQKWVIDGSCITENFTE